MKIEYFSPQFNNNNLGDDYIAQMEDGSILVRSSAGKWAIKTKSKPLTLDDLQADLDLFLKNNNGVLATENDIKVDNASQVVIDPQPTKLEAVIEKP